MLANWLPDIEPNAISEWILYKNCFEQYSKAADTSRSWTPSCILSIVKERSKKNSLWQNFNIATSCWRIDIFWKQKNRERPPASRGRREEQCCPYIASVSRDHQKTVKMFLQLFLFVEAYTLPCSSVQAFAPPLCRRAQPWSLQARRTSHTIHSRNSTTPPRKDWTSWFGIWQYFHSL